ncbi:hypothetical protein PHLGIDRAFT_128669 [Phlebiopsis gigantea 11061_1 CR5-6]|uniref:HNH nuclease domain-containing protein n=1 Tax=Phlebiopsis gigantea (strain 11061_1 CR5-6) TaxID=745531 RepID=A0A0C3S8Y9_PHLG1|nr:hypothetical protein PHLGIDRAFT_128669 [Phlebiopsis gigantea 11061_1 CR5-6]
MTLLPELFSTRLILPEEACPPEWIEQYNRLRSAEAVLVSQASPKGQRVAVSCLGHLLRELDKREAVEEVVLAVQDADDASLPKVGKYYIQYFICLFRRSGGRTPPPSDHPSRPDVYETVRQVTYNELSPANLNHQRAKKAALERDGYRCVASGIMHFRAPQEMLREYSERYQGQPILALECSHIIPESLNNFEGHDKKTHETSAMYSLLKAFGYPHCFYELNGANIHRLQNILTLEKNMHEHFDTLNLWFEPVGNEDSYQYQTCLANPLFGLSVDKNEYGHGCIVKLGPNDNLPAPSREYLALHAACCRVAHASGAAGYLDESDRRFEEVHMITSSDDLDALNGRLWITAF